MFFASTAASPAFENFWWVFALTTLFFLWQVRAITWPEVTGRPWWVKLAIIPHGLGLVFSIGSLVSCAMRSFLRSLGA